MKNSCKFLIFITIITLSKGAFACSCNKFNLSDRFQDSEGVFIAKLISAKIITPEGENKWPYVEGIFEVTSTFKGSPIKEVTLRTGTGGGDCGVQMSIARKFIIFKSNSDYIGTCGGSRAIHSYDEKELVKKLTNLTKQD